MANLKEADLYPLLKGWLEANGYVVHAEVGDCDIAARKGDELVLIEMKRAINLDLLLQVTRRQKTHASVYAAVPAPAVHDKRWRALQNLLKRLEVGLLLVRLHSAVPRIEVAFHPVKYTVQRSQGETRALLREMAGRSVSLNTGGTNRRKIVTAYRERAVGVAVGLELLGPAAPKEVRALGATDKAGEILLANHYGWFERLRPGVYGLTAAGVSSLADAAYAPLVREFRRRFVEKREMLAKAAALADAEKRAKASSRKTGARPARRRSAKK